MSDTKQQEGLIGSNKQPAMINITAGQDVPLGDIVRFAHGESKMSEDEWNKLTQPKREKLIEEAIATLRKEAADEIAKATPPAPSAADIRANLAQQRRAAGQPHLQAVPQVQWTVYDTLAKLGSARSHDIVTGKHPSGELIISTYGLRSDGPTPMPKDHAMKFLKDKAFKVMDEHGNLVHAIETREGVEVNLNLKADEVVVKLDELSTDALLKRAKLLPGSEVITDESDRAAMVAFIINNRIKNAVGVARGSEDAPEDPTAGELLELEVPATARKAA